jgi:hypothetical protein
MPEQQLTQPWKAFWSPNNSPDEARHERVQTPVEKGKTVIISDQGGGTPKIDAQLYKADAAPNTAEVHEDVLIEKCISFSHVRHC